MQTTYNKFAEVLIPIPEVIKLNKKVEDELASSQRATGLVHRRSLHYRLLSYFYKLPGYEAK